jgi:hypothetical protein
MAKVMNRAARRAAGKGRAYEPQIKVQVSNRIAVVPMAHVETYVEHEILREGSWGSRRRLIILRPPEDVGLASGDWWPTQLERMRETRRRKGTLPIEVDLGAGQVLELDVGLVDVTVSFDMPPCLPAMPATRDDYDRTLTENLHHFDAVCAGALHDQMIVATVPHVFRPDGSRLLHYHNLIFGLRQEVRGDLDILGPLDLEPLLKALAQTGPLSIMGGMKQ